MTLVALFSDNELILQKYKLNARGKAQEGMTLF